MGSIKKPLRSQRLEINWSVPYLFSGRLKIWRYCYILRCINVISTVISTSFLVRFIHHLNPSNTNVTYLSLYIFEASAVNHPPPFPNYFKKRGDGIILKIDKIKKYRYASLKWETFFYQTVKTFTISNWNCYFWFCVLFLKYMVDRNTI